MDNINGIPIRRIADVIHPVLVRYGRSVNDPVIRADILADIYSAIFLLDWQSSICLFSEI